MATDDDPSAGPLSVAAEDHLKEIYKATEWGADGVSTSELARALGTTPASVSDMVKRLGVRGLVDHRPYRPVRLTDAGRTAAVRVVRRHRLLETFLVAELGYTWDEVHDEAEALEHWVSERLVARLDARLGHPAVDPHGDPIPRADGSVDAQHGLVTPGEAEVGEYVVARLSDDDPGLLVYCAERGLTPGTRVRLVGREPAAGTVTLAVDGAEVVLGGGPADAVHLRPVGDEGTSTPAR